jgi:alkylation response protein AidB-like acyl-CoA dehydrogenase
MRLVEPSFMNGIPSPYFKQSHIDFQKRLREYIESDVVPHIDEWTEKKSYPHHVHRQFYKLGAQQAVFRVPQSLGGPPTGQYDSFHEMIVWMELARVSLNSVTFMMGIDSMALPPIVYHGPAHLKELIVYTHNRASGR